MNFCALDSVVLEYGTHTGLGLCVLNFFSRLSMVSCQIPEKRSLFQKEVASLSPSASWLKLLKSQGPIQGPSSHPFSFFAVVLDWVFSQARGEATAAMQLSNNRSGTPTHGAAAEAPPPNKSNAPANAAPLALRPCTSAPPDIL